MKSDIRPHFSAKTVSVDATELEAAVKQKELVEKELRTRDIQIERLTVENARLKLLFESMKHDREKLAHEILCLKASGCHESAPRDILPHSQVEQVTSENRERTVTFWHAVHHHSLV